MVIALDVSTNVDIDNVQDFLAQRERNSRTIKINTKPQWEQGSEPIQCKKKKLHSMSQGVSAVECSVWNCLKSATLCSRYVFCFQRQENS